mgnify:CR=1 FL=1
MEDPSRFGPNILLEGQRQSDAADVARMRLLALVDAARGLPKAIAVATRPVRHLAPPFDQAGRHHRLEENPDRHDAAIIMPAPEPYPPPIPRARATTAGITPTIAPAHTEKQT